MLSWGGLNRGSRDHSGVLDEDRRRASWHERRRQSNWMLVIRMNLGLPIPWTFNVGGVDGDGDDGKEGDGEGKDGSFMERI